MCRPGQGPRPVSYTHLVRLAQTAASSTGWTKLGIVASRQMQARLAPDVEIQDADYSLSNADVYKRQVNVL